MVSSFSDFVCIYNNVFVFLLESEQISDELESEQHLNLNLRESKQLLIVQADQLTKSVADKQSVSGTGAYLMKQYLYIFKIE